VDVVFLNEGVGVREIHNQAEESRTLRRSGSAKISEASCTYRLPGQEGTKGSFLTAYFAKLFTCGILLLLGRVGGNFIRMGF
jgi:hypothetical protein